VCWRGGQHLLFSINQSTGIEGRNLESVPMRDGVGRTGLDAVSAKNAAVVIDVVNLGIAFRATYALFGGILGGFDIDTVGRTGGRAEKAGNTLLQTVLIALENVYAAKTLLKLGTFQRPGPLGIVLHGRGLEHLQEGDGHALRDGRYVLQNRHKARIHSIPDGLKVSQARGYS
jgi:hypothetical protein